MSTFDNTGLTVDTYQETKAAIEADLKAAFGESIRLDPQSVFGQIVAIISERIANQNELIQILSGNFNPNSANGTILSELVMLNGIERREAVYSSVSLTVTANSKGSTIPAGSQVSDPITGVKFATDSETVVAPSGTEQVSATAIEPGAIVAEAGSLTKIETPVFGWASVTNASAASVGSLEESDTDLRIRRHNAARANGAGSTGAIYSALANIDSVDLVSVLDNKTSETDSRGIPANSIWCVVRGGTDEEIAAVIYTAAPAGIGWYGSDYYDYADPITGQTFRVYWSRPVDVPIYVKVELHKTAAYPSNGDNLIKQQIVDYFTGAFDLDGTLIAPFSLGATIQASRLYSPINTVGGHSIHAVKIGLTNPPTSSADLVLASDELPTIDTASITVVGV